MKKDDKSSPLKIRRVKNLIAAGFYDEFIQDIAELIVSGNTPLRKQFLEATGIHEQITKDIKNRANLSFYAAILSMFFAFALFVSGLLIALKYNIWAGSLTVISSAISGFITTTFLRIHRISLEQLNRFYRPVMKEIFSAIEHAIDNLSDNDSRENARMLLIRVLLKIIGKTQIDCTV